MADHSHWSLGGHLWLLAAMCNKQVTPVLSWSGKASSSCCCCIRWLQSCCMSPSARPKARKEEPAPAAFLIRQGRSHLDNYNCVASLVQSVFLTENSQSHNKQHITTTTTSRARTICAAVQQIILMPQCRAFKSLIDAAEQKECPQVERLCL